jgi:hypothetical protein
MALLVEETLMYFCYTYAPTLTHQGGSVITEISSTTLHTNGYKNTVGNIVIDVNSRCDDLLLMMNNHN